MSNFKNILAVILARGGSKGIPDKNIMNFCGQPLIAWTIQQSNKTILIDKTFVSTDSEKIFQVSHQYPVGWFLL